eukprot:Selendium_serpulae@DN1893_c0_g1_i2.p1
MSLTQPRYDPLDVESHRYLEEALEQPKGKKQKIQSVEFSEQKTTKETITSDPQPRASTNDDFKWEGTDGSVVRVSAPLISIFRSRRPDGPTEAAKTAPSSNLPVLPSSGSVDLLKSIVAKQSAALDAEPGSGSRSEDKAPRLWEGQG